MPSRLHVTSDDHDVIAEIDGHDVRVAGSAERLTVTALGDGRYRARGDSAVWEGAAAEAAGLVWVTVESEVFAFQVGTSPARVRAREEEAVMAPMPATVVRLVAAPGQAVRRGDLLIALEAMKMELPIRAPRDGVVRGFRCREGEIVQPGLALVTWEDTP